MREVSILLFGYTPQICGLIDQPATATHLTATATRTTSVLPPERLLESVLPANAKPPPVALNFSVGSRSNTPHNPPITLTSETTTPSSPTHTILAPTTTPPARIWRADGSSNNGDNWSWLARPSSTGDVRRKGAENQRKTPSQKRCISFVFEWNDFRSPCADRPLLFSFSPHPLPLPTFSSLSLHQGHPLPRHLTQHPLNPPNTHPHHPRRG